MSILIIDSSYYNFYRYTATLAWYRRSPDRLAEADGVSWLDNYTFMEMFEKKWFETLTRLCRKFKINRSDILFAQDGNRVWRYDIYPEYKASRKIIPADDPHSPKPVFEHVNANYHPRVNGAKFLLVPSAEGDDIIAIATHYIRAVFPQTRVIILTGDHDLHQLSEPNVEIYQLKNYEKFNIDNPRMSLAIKILAGDPSDNIPSAFKRCGKITAKKLAEDPTKLNDALCKYGRKQYDINQELIDFDYIPDVIVKEIEKLLDRWFAV